MLRLFTVLITLILPASAQHLGLHREIHDAPQTVLDDPTTPSATASPPTPSPAYTYVPPQVSLDPVVGAPDIDSAGYKRLTNLLPQVLKHGVEISIHSWELGAMIESLIEVYNPELSPFAYNSDTTHTPWAALQVAAATLGNYTWTGSPSTFGSDHPLKDYIFNQTSPVPLRSQPLVNGDGALGDPCAPGPGVWTLAKFANRQDVRDRLGLNQSGQDYAWAVGNQLAYLQANNVSSNETISQRDGFFELWSDMGYMIPPFPTYIGLEIGNVDLMQFGINQWLLESTALLDTTRSIYRHVNDWDARLWATGNAWSVYGAVRVLASISAAGKERELLYQVSNVQNQLSSIFDAIFQQLDDENLVPCYMQETNATLARGDASGTTLIAAAYYRFLNIAPLQTTPDLTAKAERAFDGVLAQLDDEGWLGHVVDPLGLNGWIVVDGVRSPEGQSFLGHLWAARTAAGV